MSDIQIDTNTLQAKLAEIEKGRDDLRIQQAYQLGMQDGAAAMLKQLIEQQQAGSQPTQPDAAA